MDADGTLGIKELTNDTATQRTIISTTTYRTHTTCSIFEPIGTRLVPISSNLGWVPAPTGTWVFELGGIVTENRTGFNPLRRQFCNF